MIHFITDILSPSEPDLLPGNEDKDLVFVSLEGRPLSRIAAPEGGWTHDALCQHSKSVDEGDAYLCPAGEYNPDNTFWVGSSEV